MLLSRNLLKSVAASRRSIPGLPVWFGKVHQETAVFVWLPGPHGMVIKPLKERRLFWVRMTGSHCLQIFRIFRKLNPALSGEPLELRLKQLLGLPSASQKVWFVEFYVEPSDLFRPSADPEINDMEFLPSDGLFQIVLFTVADSHKPGSPSSRVKLWRDGYPGHSWAIPMTGESLERSWHCAAEYVIPANIGQGFRSEKHLEYLNLQTDSSGWKQYR